MDKRQADLLANEDWRFHAIDAVGTGIGMLATTEAYSGQLVSFGLPSAPAIYLSLAREAHTRRLAIDVDTSFVKHPPPQGTWPEQHKQVFDFFESFVAEIIFAFTAIEAFANESIPPTFTYVWKKGKKFSGVEIERYVPLDEKLKNVIPQAHNLSNPADTTPWRNYQALKKIRDRLVHLKSVDRSASGPEQQTIWGLLLENRQRDFPETAYDLIGTYSLAQNRRWFRLGKPV